MSNIGARLQDRVCVITGSASGVGRAASLVFVDEGAIVVGVDIDEAGGLETLDMVHHAGGHGSFVAGDVAEPELARTLAAHCNHEYGRVDVLFNNAAIAFGDTADAIDVDRWNRVMAVNVIGPALLAEALAPALSASGHGSIINHGSIDGVMGNPHAASYSASKAALNGLTRVMAHTYGNQGIRANSISSGNLMGDTTGRLPTIGNGLFPDDAARVRFQESLVNNTPGGRVGTVEEAARVALFLATDEASYLNGIDILTTGGRGALTPGTTIDL